MVKSAANIPEETVRKAVVALVKHLQKESSAQKKSTDLFEDAQSFHLVVALKKSPQKASNMPLRIPIPNPIFDFEGAEICLFVKDHKGEGHKAAKERLKSIQNSGVAKVMGVSKLKANFFEFEAKRKLCAQYDLFLADDRIIPSLPKLLGKVFFKKKKQPIPVDLTKKDWAGQIRKALSATYTHLNEGSCVNVKVAHSELTEDEIVENVQAVIAGLAGVLPQKLKNIQALYLKTNESVALPIFSASPEPANKIPTASSGKKAAS